MAPADPHARERSLFDALDQGGDGLVRPRIVLEALERAGLPRDDIRVRSLMGRLRREAGPMDFARFCEEVGPNIRLVERALNGALVIPEFDEFTRRVEAIYEQARAHEGGKVATYIPQLARVKPDQFGVSICTVDGQRLALGDADVEFSVQSTCKPINYCFAIEHLGEEYVHQHVGREPSGHGFNEIRLDSSGKPHNPLINAGAIAVCSLILPESSASERFERIIRFWRELAGHQRIGFSNAVYLSELKTADRNFALGYFMREHGVFPDGTELVDTLEFYFQCCSIEATTRQLSVVAATLANGGICPLTNERIISAKTVQHCLSLMSSSGMYDFSGEFAFRVGLPAKSGVSGVIIGVVPNVMGFCTWSPRLTRHGNSERGLAFFQGLVDTFNFHHFDSLTGASGKIDPRVRKDELRTKTVELIWAAARGNVEGVQQLVSQGVSPSEVDYDRRTALHLAATEGHLALVDYLLAHGVEPAPRDRYGRTPIECAREAGHEEIVARLDAATKTDPG